MAEVVALVDYGAGNLHSVANALRAAGAKGVKVTSDPDAVRAADRVVLPGVGSFKACAEGLRAIPHMIESMQERVFVGGAPFLLPLLYQTGLGFTPVGWHTTEGVTYHVEVSGAREPIAYDVAVVGCGD